MSASNQQTQQIKLFAQTLKILRVEFFPDLRLGNEVAHSMSGTSDELLVFLEAIHDALSYASEDDLIREQGDYLLVTPWRVGRHRPVPILKAQRDEVLRQISDLLCNH